MPALQRRHRQPLRGPVEREAANRVRLSPGADAGAAADQGCGVTRRVPVVPEQVRRPMSATRSGPLLWAACCAGREPAESLDDRDREDLVAELVARGWSLTEIATLTRMTSYTTARIAARVVIGISSSVAVSRLSKAAA